MILRIVSPEKVIYKGEVQMVKLPGTVGQFTVLENHAPLVSTLTPGEIVYKGSEEEKSVQIRAIRERFPFAFFRWWSNRKWEKEFYGKRQRDLI